MNLPSIIHYSRVSSDRQLQGTGIAQQKDLDLLQQLSTKLGLPIDTRTFSDKGESAYKGEHLDKDFGRIINLIKSGEIAKGSIIVVAALDRISRLNPIKAQRLFLSLIDEGVKVYTASDGETYDSSIDPMMLSMQLMKSVMLFALAHEESLAKARRTVDSTLKKIEYFNQGLRAPDGYAWTIRGTGSEPLWIDTSNGSVAPHPYYFEAVQSLIPLMKQGFGGHYLLKHLKENYPRNDVYKSSARQGQKKDWSLDFVNKLLNSDNVAGIKNITVKHPSKGEFSFTLPDYYPAIVPMEELQQLRTLKKARKATVTSKTHISVVTGLDMAFCSCGGRVGSQYRNKRHSLTLMCKAHKQQRNDCEGWHLTSTYLEKGLISLAKAIVFPSQSEPSKPDFTALEATIESKEMELEQATQLMKEFGVSKAVLLQTQALEADLDTLKEELQRQQQEAVVLPVANANDWAKIGEQHLNIDADNLRMELRELVRATYKKVTVIKVGDRHYVVVVQLKANDEMKSFTINQGKVITTDEPSTAIFSDTIAFDNLNQEQAQTYIDTMTSTFPVSQLV